jgi:predicted site-specific integrase-resolvase
MKTTRRKFPEVMNTGEVGAAFGVDPHSVTRYANTGKLRSFRTPGGHRRFYRAEVEALLAGKPLTSDQLDALVNGDAS